MSKPPIPSSLLLSTLSRSLRLPSPTLRRPQCLHHRLPSSLPTRMHMQLQQQSRTYKTVQEQRSRYRAGPFSYTAGFIFLASGAGLIFYFRYEKARMERLRVAEASKGVGRPKVGGPFELVDQEGGRFGDGDMRGKFSLVYFGFSHCPDICPEELDKMARMIDLVNASPLLSATLTTPITSSSSSSPSSLSAKPSSLPPLLPLFITCDPARDTPGVLKEYLSEFHPAIVGLTGTWE